MSVPILTLKSSQFRRLTQQPCQLHSYTYFKSSSTRRIEIKSASTTQTKTSQLRCSHWNRGIFGPHTKNKLIHIPTLISNQFDPTHWNLVKFDYPHENLAKFDPPQKGQANLDPTAKTSHVRSRTLKWGYFWFSDTKRSYVRSRQWNQGFLDLCTKTKYIPIPTLRSSQARCPTLKAIGCFCANRPMVVHRDYTKYVSDNGCMPMMT